MSDKDTSGKKCWCEQTGTKPDLRGQEVDAPHCIKGYVLCTAVCVKEYQRTAPQTNKVAVPMTEAP